MNRKSESASSALAHSILVLLLARNLQHVIHRIISRKLVKRTIKSNILLLARELELASRATLVGSGSSPVGLPKERYGRLSLSKQ